MPILEPEEIGSLLTPFLPSPAGSLLLAQLATYLELLMKWNLRTNLTSVRDAREVVTRHFGESLFAARFVGAGTTSLLDFGSGAGFPGIPICLLRPDLNVTLAESQHKKASFLREVVRVLGLQARVWGGRVEDFPPRTIFDCVALRAVDRMAQAVLLAQMFASDAMLLLTTADAPEIAAAEGKFPFVDRHPVPGSSTRVVASLSR